MLLPLVLFIELRPVESYPCVMLLTFLFAAAMVDAVVRSVWFVPL